MVKFLFEIAKQNPKKAEWLAEKMLAKPRKLLPEMWAFIAFAVRPRHKELFTKVLNDEQIFLSIPMPLYSCLKDRLDCLNTLSKEENRIFLEELEKRLSRFLGIDYMGIFQLKY
jgi:hypothetical protein